MKKRNNNTKIKNSNWLWLFGKHPVFLALQKKRREVFEILVTKNSVAEIEEFLEKNKLFAQKNKVKIVENSYLHSLSDGAVHQGFALNCSFLPLKSQNALLEEASGENKPRILIMDQLQDPHNIGAIVRSACAFGFKKIVFLEHNFPKESATMNKAASGMMDNVDLYLVGNISNLLAKLKEVGYWCVGLAGEGVSAISEAKKFDNIALVIGSEGDGIRHLVKQNCDLLVRIQMANEVESLNASVAASIAMFEISKI